MKKLSRVDLQKYITNILNEASEFDEFDELVRKTYSAPSTSKEMIYLTCKVTKDS